MKGSELLVLTALLESSVEGWGWGGGGDWKERGTENKTHAHTDREKKKLAALNMIGGLVSKMRNEAIREVHIHYLALISFL